MKKSLSVLLTLAMIITLFSGMFTVSANTVTEPEVYYYNDFTDNTGMANTVENASYGALAVSDDGESVMKIWNEKPGLTPKWTLDSPIAPGEEVDLAFEFRIRIKNPNKRTDVAREFTTFGAKTNSTHLASEQTIALYNNLTCPGQVRWSKEVNEVIEGVTIDEEAWNTFTLIYSASEEKRYRELYINGVYAGKSPEGETENKYAAKGSLNPIFMPILLPAEWVEIDYLKAYEYEETGVFSASIADAYESGIVVSFSSAPANISKEMFSLSDGTSISTLMKIDETTYRLIPGNELLLNETYTLSISNELISTLGKEISTSSLELTPNARDFIDEDTLPYFNTFAAADAIDDKKWTAPETNVSAVVENGYLKLSITEGGNGIKFTPGYENASETRQPLVLEYKIKFNSADENNAPNYFTMSSKGTYGVQIYPKTAKANFTSATDPQYNLSGSMSDWHTVSLVYSTEDNTKKFYWDGKYIATSVDTGDANENLWDNAYKLGTVRFYVYAKTGTINTYMDSLKLYEAPVMFGAQILNSEATEFGELMLDFNATVKSLTADALRVNGTIPEKVELVDEEKQIYKLTLSEKLKPQTEYKLFLNGVSNTVGQIAYNDVAFKTRALKGDEIYYDISGAGSVKAGEEAIANGSFSEAGSHKLTVKPNKGYEATVKVNGEAVEESASAYATYDITVSDGAYVEVSFTALEAEETPSFISIPYIFTEGNTSYTFARINKALESKNYGVIVSEDKAEPVIEDVNGETTFKFPAIRGTNKYGEFGIGIKDNAEGKLGNKYYVRPYAVSEGTYYYGTPVEVNK